jgi:hypothetical protein
MTGGQDLRQSTKAMALPTESIGDVGILDKRIAIFSGV